MIDRPLDLSEAELARVGALLQRTFGGLPHVDGSYLAWCYLESPAGRAVGRNAWSGDELAAHYATIPLRARLFGREARGLLSLNTATHPDHQGKGLFTRLAEATYADAVSAGYDFVVGVANAASTPGFVRKLGFQLVGPLDVRIGVGSSAPPVGGTAALQWERLWNAEELAWRLRCPARAYRRVEGKATTTVWAETGRLGVWVEMARLEGVAGDAARRLERRHARSPLRMWMGLDPARRWSSRPWWVRLPDRARPSPLNLVYRDLREPGRRLDRDRVRFAAIDFDAY